MGDLLLMRRDQSGEFEQIFQAERRPARRDDNHWVRRNHIGPMGRNRDQPPLSVTVVEEQLAAVVPGRHRQELLAAVGMEWMDDAKSSRRIVRIGCS